VDITAQRVRSANGPVPILYMWPQGGSLISGTIRANLELGLPADAAAVPHEEQLQRVLEIASAQFVFELPDGLDTVLGEGGQRSVRRTRAAHCHCPSVAATG